VDSQRTAAEKARIALLMEHHPGGRRTQHHGPRHRGVHIAQNFFERKQHRGDRSVESRRQRVGTTRNVAAGSRPRWQTLGSKMGPTIAGNVVPASLEPSRLLHHRDIRAVFSTHVLLGDSPDRIAPLRKPSGRSLFADAPSRIPDPRLNCQRVSPSPGSIPEIPGRLFDAPVATNRALDTASIDSIERFRGEDIIDFPYDGN
jgi:hypothetical protein